jgi:hypothetical protein
VIQERGRSAGAAAVRGSLPARVVAVDPVRVHAAVLGEVGGELLEADHVHDRVHGLDERRLAAELAERSRGIGGALGGAALAFQDEAANASSTAAR